MRSADDLGETRMQAAHGYAFALGSEHPAYHVLPSMMPEPMPTYAWYMRVPDLPAFVRHIAPVLERRLAASYAVGWSGELKLSFVRDGIRIAFQNGAMSNVERWLPPQREGRLAPKHRDALFPDLTFLQVLFGFRSVADIESAYPDCRVTSDEARYILDTLFPRRPSRAWGIE